MHCWPWPAASRCPASGRCSGHASPPMAAITVAAARTAAAGGAVTDTEVGDLVLAARQGDKASWEALVHRYSGLVWSVARGYRLGLADAADVFQTTWLRLVEHLGRISDPGQVGAWLATTARHEALRIARGVTRTVL